MEKREVPTSEYEPEDVPQRRSEAFACLRDDGAAERPDAEQGDSQRSNAERDRHDEDEAEHSGEYVSDEHPEAGKHEPEDVPEQSHVASLTGSFWSCGAESCWLAGDSALRGWLVTVVRGDILLERISRAWCRAARMR